MFAPGAFSYKNGGMNQPNFKPEWPAADSDTLRRRRRVLLVFATTEGQTARIATALAGHMETLGHDAELADLRQRESRPDPAAFDAVVVLASVHAGKHQPVASSFVGENAARLAGKITAFLSVSLSAAADTAEGRRRADEQVSDFLDYVDWRPDFVETLGGAIRYSRFSRTWRWILRVSQSLFRKQLGEQGWPALTVDREFTDWTALQAFAERFCARLESASS